MPHLETTEEPDATTPPGQTAFTLDPIRTLGSAALDPSGDPALLGVTLRQLEARRDSQLHEVVTITSDDLLKSTNNSPVGVQSIPADAKLEAAILDFLFTDADRPHPVRVKPPSTVEAQFPGDAPRVLAWLSKSRLRLQHLATATAALFLALTAAVTPFLGDGDGDDDDPTSDRHILRA